MSSTLLLSILSGTADAVVTSEIVQALQTLHDKDKQQYEEDIKLEVIAMKVLTPMLQGVKSKFVASIIDAFQEGVRQSAELNGVDISDKSLPPIE